MMSSSAEVDSFRFLRGGRGRDEEGSRSASRSESEERRNTEPLTWLLLIPFDLLSRSLSDLDFLFFCWLLDRGPSTSFMANIQVKTHLERLKPLSEKPLEENFHNIPEGVVSQLDPMQMGNIQEIKTFRGNSKLH